VQQLEGGLLSAPRLAGVVGHWSFSCANGMSWPCRARLMVEPRHRQSQVKFKWFLTGDSWVDAAIVVAFEFAVRGVSYVFSFCCSAGPARPTDALETGVQGVVFLSVSVVSKQEALCSADLGCRGSSR
jgi:hypothetical protein